MGGGQGRSRVAPNADAAACQENDED